MKGNNIIDNIILHLILLLIPVSVTAQDSIQEQKAIREQKEIEIPDNVEKNVKEAIQAYQAENYAKAIELFEKEIEKLKEIDFESSDLFYNLGNAYFRDNEVAKALLYYEKALLLDPGDRDIRHNIAYARTRIEDKIEGVDTFFLQSWFEAVQNLQGSNAWAQLAIMLFLLFIITLSFFLFTKKITVKKTAFYTGIIIFAFLILSNVFSVRQKNKLTDRNTAIIMAGSVSVKNSPDINSKELFIIHAGTKVRITKDDGRWLEIEIENGNVGWMTRDQLEII
ncbi:tetratricopeptide repeat protein [Dysgonomonas sp. 216]|uniref:tetratricopeptide repeat protein n=1 Tax=Dysgonomonas sp. 216 TaxID=2302934 RepID=UPI0013D65D1A|nr:tetratricopeptide repeat protein [Dysgonomonas sp. 216]NDW17334.1 tetratricopeptide repeat protein [Dysgonomonas sp. 216]